MYVFIGGAAIAYGLYTLLLRSQNPDKFSKLTAMKEMWGDQTGALIHLVSYSLLPIGFGIFMLIRS